MLTWLPVDLFSSMEGSAIVTLSNKYTHRVHTLPCWLSQRYSVLKTNPIHERQVLLISFPPAPDNRLLAPQSKISVLQYVHAVTTTANTFYYANAMQ